MFGAVQNGMIVRIEAPFERLGRAEKDADVGAESRSTRSAQKLGRGDEYDDAPSDERRADCHQDSPSEAPPRFFNGFRFHLRSSVR